MEERSEQNNNCPRCETEMYLIMDSESNFVEFFCSECSFSHRFDKDHATSNATDECFRCSTCEGEVFGVENLSFHLALHFKDGIFICNMCHESFETESEFKNHQVIHDEVCSCKCQFCEEQFNDANDLQTHIKMKHESTCICPYCGNQVPLTADFNSTFVMYCCPVCGGQFSQQLNGANTVPLSNDTERPFECGVCRRKFTLSCNLRRHLSVHTGERPFPCDVCHKRFKAKAALQRHEIIHTGVYPFQCPSCKQRFNQTANLWKHMLIHKEDYPYYCSVCDKGFNQRSNLKKHMRVHERKPIAFTEIKTEPVSPSEVSRPIITFLKPANSSH